MSLGDFLRNYFMSGWKDECVYYTKDKGEWGGIPAYKEEAEKSNQYDDLEVIGIGAKSNGEIVVLVKPTK